MPPRPDGRCGKGCARFSCRACARTARNPPREWPAKQLQEQVVARHSAANTPPEKSPTAKSTTSAWTETCQSRGRRYLTIAGTSFLAAHTSATIHPITLHPRNRLSRKIESRSRLLRAKAMIDGRKYIKNGKPRSGKNRNIDRIMNGLPFYSLALSRPRCSLRNTNALFSLSKSRHESRPLEDTQDLGPKFT